MNIPTLPSIYVVEVTCFIRKYCQSFKLNSSVYSYNTQRKKDIHIQSHKTDMYEKNVLNMRTKIYNKLPGYIKEIDSYKACKKKLKLFLLLHTFYSVEKSVSL